jgi:hypothetical protein
VKFEDYLSALGPIRRVVATGDVAEHAVIQQAAEALTAMATVDRESLAALVQKRPEWVPTLGLAAGLSQEGLKNLLKHRLDTSGWITLARQRPKELIQALDEDRSLVAELEAQRARAYTFGDVLVARASSRQSAGTAIAGGRAVEDAIEKVVVELGLPYELRTRFEGRGSRTAPCDVAISAGGADAKIVCAAKGFDSTGSKLTDAVREIESMAEVRLPSQFVFAVVDGIGWKSRRSDLRQIFALLSSHSIDGLYTLALLDKFAADLDAAANRLGIERRNRNRST